MHDKGITNIIMKYDVHEHLTACTSHVSCIESNLISIQVNVLFTQTLVALPQCGLVSPPLTNSCNMSLLPISLLPPALPLPLTCRMGWSPSQPLAQRFSVSLQLALSLKNGKEKNSFNKAS